jgi:hypothetical protein
VLKALARDVEDRYSNAIDLHDELQAFVYTAGEFYSRKDLASWMKGTFAREIEDETAKLEAYRQLPAPDHVGPRVSRPAPATRSPGMRRTLAMPSVPPPPPRAASARGNGRVSQQLASVPQPSQQMARGAGLEWDDEELETTIYDHEPEDFPAAPHMDPGHHGMSAASMQTIMPTHDEPDLSSLGAHSGGGSRTIADVYAELAAKFPRFVDVLHEVRSEVSFVGGDVVQLYRGWLRTRSEWVERRLRSAGLIVPDAGEGFLQ